MFSPTYGQLSTDLLKELDLEGEIFITKSELLSYFNEGVSKVEADIHTVYEDYFLTSIPYPFVNNIPSYNLPPDIYAQKIRQMWFDDLGARNYEVRKIRQLKEIPFLLNQTQQSQLYRWMLTNGSKTYSFTCDAPANATIGDVYTDGTNQFTVNSTFTAATAITAIGTAAPAGSGTLSIVSGTGDSSIPYSSVSFTGGLLINIYPIPLETVNFATLWYIRNAARFTGADTDVCDIPEFTTVIVQYVKWKCIQKETGPASPGTQEALSDYNNMRKQMVETLSARIPDEHNEIIQDFSFYEDFDDWTYGGNY
jgi:hypothetical protein